MKSIRYNTFETNSSSMHSLTLGNDNYIANICDNMTRYKNASTIGYVWADNYIEDPDNIKLSEVYRMMCEPDDNEMLEIQDVSINLCVCYIISLTMNDNTHIIEHIKKLCKENSVHISDTNVVINEEWIYRFYDIRNQIYELGTTLG